MNINIDTLPSQPISERKLLLPDSGKQWEEAIPVYAELVDRPMSDLERNLLDASLKSANAQVVDVGYGTVDWANKIYKAGRRCFDQLAEWIFNFMLYEPNGDKRENPLFLSEAVEIKRQQGFEAPYASVHRWVSSLPGYKQLQGEKKAKPNSAALRKEAEKARKRDKSHSEKCHSQTDGNILSANNVEVNGTFEESQNVTEECESRDTKDMRNILVDEETAERIHALANHKGVSPGHIIKLMIDKFFED
jgi:hypothetical protein